MQHHYIVACDGENKIRLYHSHDGKYKSSSLTPAALKWMDGASLEDIMNYADKGSIVFRICEEYSEATKEMDKIMSLWDTFYGEYPDECEACGGNGYLSDSSMCLVCAGKGHVEEIIDAEYEELVQKEQQKCKACGGTGSTSIGGTCIPCKGTGLLQMPF